MTNLLLKEFRVKAGLLQREVAHHLNVTQPNYHKFECGKSFPNSTQIIILCDLFKCTPNDLFGIHGIYDISISKMDQD